MHSIRKLVSGNVVVMRLSGKLTHRDYQEIVPFLAKLIKKYKKIRLVVELDNFDGWSANATLDDIVFLFKYGFSIEKIAFLVQAEHRNIMLLLDRPFGRAIGENAKYFHYNDKEDAWQWIKHGSIDVIEENFPE